MVVMNKKSFYLIVVGLVLLFSQGFVLSIMALVQNPKIVDMLFIGSGYLYYLAFALILSGLGMHIYHKYKYPSSRIKTKGLIVARIGLLVAFAPALIALIAVMLGFIFGCESNGGNPGTCAIGGSSMGNLVWTGFMIHWLNLVTLLPGLIIWGIGTFWHNSLVKKMDI